MSKERRFKKITFVVVHANGSCKLLQHQTDSHSVTDAFINATENDDIRSIIIDCEYKLMGAIPGHHEFMKENIRKPTYQELMSMVDKTKHYLGISTPVTNATPTIVDSLDV